MIDVVSKINDDLLPMEDDYDMMEEDLIKMENYHLWFSLTRAVWIHLNVLKWLGIINRVVMKSIILGIHSKNDPYILELTKINNFHNGNFSPRGLFNRPTASFLGYRVIFRW